MTDELYNKSFQPTRPLVTALADARPAPNVFVRWKLLFAKQFSERS